MCQIPWTKFLAQYVFYTGYGEYIGDTRKIILNKMSGLFSVVNRGRVFFCFCSIVLLAGCESYQEQKDKLTDTPQRGKIYVSADESFKPVIESQVKVYESYNPDASIVVNYKPEADCLLDLLNDTVRMVITTRKISKGEENLIVDSLRTGPESIVVAKDAVAVIVHPDAEETFFTMQEVRDVLTGKSGEKFVPVFDGMKATSTVRYIVDSVLRGEKLTISAMAATNSQDVIDYVARNKKAFGLIGVSWIGNKEDTAQRSFLKKVKIAFLESTDRPGEYVQPVQENIYMGSYPMVRDLVYILKESHVGLGTGFATYLRGEIGQLVFKRAYLVPVFKKFIVRPINLIE